VNEESLLFGLAAVFAVVAVVEVVLAFVYTPALFAVAVPFAAAAYFVWYQASGRLRERAERGDANAYRGLGVGGLSERLRGPNSDRRTDLGEAQSRFGGDSRSRFGGERGQRSDADDRGKFGSGGRQRTDGRRATGRGATGQRGRRKREGARAGDAPGDWRNDGPSPAEAYRRLGLDPDADDDAVRRAYRERVKSVHPDREGGDEEEFKRVTEAYEVLRERG